MIEEKAIYREIINGYERQLAADKREQRSRIMQVYEKVPGYKQLEDRTADLSAEAAILAAMGKKEETAPLLHMLSDISAEKKQLLKDAGYDDDFISIRYICPDCRDTGYISGRKCHCFEQKLINFYYSRSGIYEKLKEENFDTFSFDMFQGPALNRIKDNYLKAREFTERFADEYRNMLFYGGVGCGKTFLSNCIAKELIDRGVAVVYVSAIAFFDILSAQRFRRSDTEERVELPKYRALFECPLLIIDDLGTEIESQAVSSELFDVLNERDLKARSTIISTNLSVEGIKDRYSERSISRLLGNYELCKFEGSDLRLMKRRNQ